MATMKNMMMDEVNKTMATISNHMDGEFDVYIARKFEDIYSNIYKELQKFAVLQAVYEESKDFYDKGTDLWEDICKYYDEDDLEAFEEMWEAIENIEL